MKTLELLHAMGDILHFSFKDKCKTVGPRLPQPLMQGQARAPHGKFLSLVFTDPTWFLMRVALVFNPSLVKSGAFLPSHMCVFFFALENNGL